MYDAFGSYDAAFHVAGIPVIAGAIILFFIPWAQRTSKTQTIEIDISEERLKNDYDLTEDILYGPRDSLYSPSIMTLNSTIHSRAQSSCAHTRTPTPTIPRFRKFSKDQSTATSPGSNVYVPVDIQDALEQLNNTRHMLERLVNDPTTLSGYNRSEKSRSELIQVRLC